VVSPLAQDQVGGALYWFANAHDARILSAKTSSQQMQTAPGQIEFAIFGCQRRRAGVSSRIEELVAFHPQQGHSGHDPITCEAYERSAGS